jgi:hypothetical protein
MKTWSEGEFDARVEKLLKAEEDNPMAYWFLSFAGEGHGVGWSGCIVQAPGFMHAYVYSGILGCRGSGEVMGLPIPPEDVPAPQYHNRLLTKEQCSEFWGEMKTIAQWCNGVLGGPLHHAPEREDEQKTE